MFLLFGFFREENQTVAERKDMAIKIMLDAGHFGKYNRSPVMDSYYESEAMWEFSVLLGEALREYGFEVSFTRAKQANDLPLYRRGASAKGCDVFLSLHSNACDVSDVDRIEVYRSVNAPHAERFAQTVADAVASCMSVSRVEVKVREGSTQGVDYYGVLRGASDVSVPYSLIVEHSFHTNPRAVAWLSEKCNLQTLAQAEARAVADYFGIPLRGDYNRDGKVNAKDYMMLKRDLLD